MIQARELEEVDLKKTRTLELVLKLKAWRQRGYEAWLEARRCGLFIVGRKVVKGSEHV